MQFCFSIVASRFGNLVFCQSFFIFSIFVDAKTEMNDMILRWGLAVLAHRTQLFGGSLCVVLYADCVS